MPKSKKTETVKEQAEVVIYSKDNCPYCVRAEDLARSQGFTIEVKKLNEDFSREQLFEEFPEARTFPQIIFKGEKIGGYDAFLSLTNKAQKT